MIKLLTLERAEIIIGETLKRRTKKKHLSRDAVSALRYVTSIAKGTR